MLITILPATVLRSFLWQTKIYDAVTDMGCTYLIATYDMIVNTNRNIETKMSINPSIERIFTATYSVIACMDNATKRSQLLVNLLNLQEMDYCD